MKVPAPRRPSPPIPLTRPAAIAHGLRTRVLAGVLATAASSVSLGLAPAARANGRFPASNGVVLAPGNEDAVLVRVTFGLLVTKDRGRSWSWICERAIGFSGPEDPSYVVTRSGAIVAGLFDGLRVSRDGGCSWEAVKTDATVFVDVTSRADGAVIALASSYDRHGDGGSLYKTQLWISKDDARSFAPLGPRFDPTLLAETVEVAPSDPSRIYVSAVRGADAPRQGALLVSRDGGNHWTEHSAKLADKELAPFIAAVDPKRAGRVYLRTSASPENPTRLLVTEDAGKSYRTLLDAKGALLGFALAPDGLTVHAGGPDDGLYTGAADGRELSPVSKLKVQCLARAGEVLWACSSEASGFVVGTSRGAGAAFEPRLHLRDITGPLACAAGTAVAKECGVDWRKLRTDLGIGEATRTDAAAAAVLVPGADAGGDAGARAPADLADGARGGEQALKRDRGAWAAAALAVVGGAWLLLRARRGRTRRR